MLIAKGLERTRRGVGVAWFEQRARSRTDILALIQIRMTHSEFLDFPGWLREGSGTLNFADGHAEAKLWRDPGTKFPARCD